MSDRDSHQEFPQRPREPVISQRPASERIAQGQAGYPARGPEQAEPTRAHRPPMPPSPPLAAPEASGLYVPWWGFALVILVVAGVTCGLWGLVLMNRGEPAAGVGPTPTPIFVVITATPTLGLAPGETGQPPAGGATLPGPEAITPTVGEPIITPTIPNESVPIQVGSTVVVAGTEGDGVAVRQGPGRTYSYFFVGNDGDVFTVVDGPREGDDYTWWSVVDPNDPNRAGWVVQDYLQAVQP